MSNKKDKKKEAAVLVLRSTPQILSDLKSFVDVQAQKLRIKGDKETDPLNSWTYQGAKNLIESLEKVQKFEEELSKTDILSRMTLEERQQALRSLFIQIWESAPPEQREALRGQIHALTEGKNGTD